MGGLDTGRYVLIPHACKFYDNLSKKYVMTAMTGAPVEKGKLLVKPFCLSVWTKDWLE